MHKERWFSPKVLGLVFRTRWRHHLLRRHGERQTVTKRLSSFPGRRALGHPQVSTGPVPEFLPPVLDCEDAPPEVQGTVQVGGGPGRHGLPGSAGAAGVCPVGGVPPVVHVHVDGWRSAHLHRRRAGAVTEPLPRCSPCFCNNGPCTSPSRYVTDLRRLGARGGADTIVPVVPALGFRPCVCEISSSFISCGEQGQHV